MRACTASKSRPSVRWLALAVSAAAWGSCGRPAGAPPADGAADVPRDGGGGDVQDRFTPVPDVGGEGGAGGSDRDARGTGGSDREGGSGGGGGQDAGGGGGSPDLDAAAAGGSSGGGSGGSSDAGFVTGLEKTQPYPATVYPAENPFSPEKALLGKILFWEEQLSSNDTHACGT